MEEIRYRFAWSRLSPVISSFSVVTSRAQNHLPTTLYLDDIAIDLPLTDQPRFLQSYVPNACDVGGAPNTAHVYDQALVLLALLARKQPEDIRRAELIARAMVQAQRNDRYFRDNRMRNAYASGELIDPHCGCARLPGKWSDSEKEFQEDEFAVGTDTGNMAWAGLALVQAHRVLPERPGAPYLAAALDLAEWIVDNSKVEDRLGGFRGGFEGFETDAGKPVEQFVSAWRSTEHNIDLVALFRHLAYVVGKSDAEAGSYWTSQAAHARAFVESMWNTDDRDRHLWTGAQESSTKLNTAFLPLDVQTWAVLGLGQPKSYEKALEWALVHCTSGRLSGFDFNCGPEPDGVWWEGTAQVAAALKQLNRGSDAKLILEALSANQIQGGAASGAIPAASVCGLTTGVIKLWRSTGERKPWLYSDQAHIGATAWYLFAMLGKNPYYVAELDDHR